MLTPCTVYLHRSTESNSTPIVQLLLDEGADFDAKDNLGRTALFFTNRSRLETIVDLLVHQYKDAGIMIDDTNWGIPLS